MGLDRAALKSSRRNSHPKGHPQSVAARAAIFPIARLKPALTSDPLANLVRADAAVSAHAASA